MTWETSDTIAAVAVVIATLSFVFSLIQYLRAKHENIIRALQGNKETVGYIAFKLSEGEFPRRVKRRKEILMSLCLAAIYERSGRSRTLLYRALKKSMERYSSEVAAIIADIEQHFEAYVEVSKLEKATKRLLQLKIALHVEQFDLDPQNDGDS
jgi:hypothetical protein